MPANITLYQIIQPLCTIMAQVLGCHVQRSLSCHDINVVDLGSNIVQLTKQNQLDSLLQEVCLHDLAHNELKLIRFIVGAYTLPSSIIECSVLVQVLVLA